MRVVRTGTILSKGVAGRRLGVCLAAFHPLALTELERRLSDGPFRVTSRRLELDGSGRLQSMAVPAAAVYVLEANAAAAATEAAIAMLQADRHHVRLIAVVERFDEASAFALLRWGVKGVLDFLETLDQLPRAVQEVARGGFWVPRPILSRFVEETLTSARRPTAVLQGRRLSPREREVRDLLLENLPNREIAERLAMSERTVKFHVSNLLGKFGVKRRADLIVLAFSGGDAQRENS
jgi:DNA-binding NarL/FixJ family response regulator